MASSRLTPWDPMAVRSPWKEGWEGTFDGSRKPPGTRPGLEGITMPRAGYIILGTQYEIKCRALCLKKQDKSANKGAKIDSFFLSFAYFVYSHACSVVPLDIQDPDSKTKLSISRRPQQTSRQAWRPPECRAPCNLGDCTSTQLNRTVPISQMTKLKLQGPECWGLLPISERTRVFPACVCLCFIAAYRPPKKALRQFT